MIIPRSKYEKQQNISIQSHETTYTHPYRQYSITVAKTELYSLGDKTKILTDTYVDVLTVQKRRPETLIAKAQGPIYQVGSSEVSS